MPYQAGDDGFVRLGMGAPYVQGREWTDGLYVAVSGGRGAGKSAGGAIRHWMYVSAHPGSTNLIGVPDYGDWQRSTFPALEKVFTAAGLRYHDDWEYNTTNHILYYHWCNAKAFVISLEDPEDARGPDAASIWIDEASNVQQKAFLNITPAMRQPGFPHQLWVTMTPPPPSHWAYWVFEPERAFEEGETLREPAVEGVRSFKTLVDKDGKPHEVQKYEYTLPPDEEAGRETASHFAIFYAATKDNPHGGAKLHADNIYLFGENSPQARRELYGEWVAMEGLVFPQFDPRKHMVPREKWPSRPTRYAVGFDYGFATFSAFIVIGMDDDGRLYLVEEFKRNSLDSQTMVKVARHLQKKYDNPMFFADSAAPDKIAALKAVGIPVWGSDKRGAKNASDPSIGLGLVAWAIGSRLKDGSQRLYVDPNLVGFRQEMSSYVWEEPGKNKDVSERPRKKNDHIVDSLRYGLMGMIHRLRWLSPAKELMTNFDLRIGA